MRIYYFIHITGTDTGLSGVPRVVKHLARELVSRPEIELVPVCWSDKIQAIVHAEQKLLDNLSRNDGPELEELSLSRQPIAPADGDWLLIPEAPHLQSHLADYPPVLIDAPIGYARRFGLKVAVIVHDILPLTHPGVANRRRMFADLASDGEEIQRLRFVGYAHALALADLILPVSQTTGDLLAKWLVVHGHDPALLPPIAPTTLAQEVFHVRRVVPRRGYETSATIEFLSLGTVSGHKNQLAAMYAFHRLTERRPELDLRLNVIGGIAADLAVPVSLIARRSRGRIVLHGWLGDPHLRALMRRARATVFVSLAEGYGLPVAESLWYGKPCLCSREGSMGEIARDGGCLTVDPGSLDEIEAGFETLATDRARYDELLGQIAARKMKTWKTYAAEIAQELAAVGSGQPRPPKIGIGAERLPERVEGGEAHAIDASGEKRRDLDAVFVVTASDLSVPDDFGAGGRPRSLYSAAAIRYDRERDGDVQQDVLFFGPYVPFPAGHYLFSLDGEIEGELKIVFTGNSGETKIAETFVTDFARRIPVDLRQPVERFEIVGMRMPSLERLVLRGAFAELRQAAEEPKGEEAPPASPGASKEDRPAAAPPSIPALQALRRAGEPACVIDDDGLPVILPSDFPAARMRVHDNGLRVKGTITFDGGAASGGDAILFFGPYLRLEPGAYSFRINGALQGSLKLRFTSNFSSRTLREVVVTGFDAPVRLIVEEPAEKVEIIGERTKHTRAMSLESIGISVQPLTGRERESDGRATRRGFRLFALAASFLPRR